MKRFIITLILFVSLVGFLAARAAPEDLVPPDPAVLTGKLENGLRYYVRRNDKPKDRAELRLVIRAGSVLEDEDQRGLAHFTEHMLFNGTEKYPKNDLIDALESLGMDFGPDINAYTSFDETVYRLSVRTDEWDQFLLGLDVLEQWAARAAHSEDEYEKERGVVYEEWRLGRGADARMLDQAFPVLLTGSRYGERLPIGDPDTILNAPVETLRRYYKDWYRPNLMAVIAVGDFDPHTVVDIIENTFSALTNSTRRREHFPVPGHKETLVTMVHDPEATNTAVEIYTKYDPPITKFKPDFRHQLTEQLFSIMFNQRLDEITRKEAPPFLQGYAFTSSWVESTALNGLVAITFEEGVLRGLEALLSEAERVQRHDFTTGELERAKKDLIKSFESYWRDRDNLESISHTEILLNTFLDNAPNPSIDWQWKTFQELLPQVSMKDISTLVTNRMTDANRVIIVSGPTGPAITELTEAEVLDVVNKVETSVLEPWVDKEIGTDLIPEELRPAPGRVSSKTRLSEIGVERWTLSNGAEVLVKQTDFKDDEILFNAWSLGGISLVDNEHLFSSRLVSDAINESGLGSFSADELRKVLAGKNVSVSPYIEPFSEGFRGSCSPEDLETLLQLVYLHHRAPRRDDIAWNSLASRLSDYLENRESDPMVRYQDLYVETLFDGHPRSRPLTSENLKEVDLDKILAVYDDRFTGAADFTYVFVGAVDPEVLLPLAETWLAGTPSGRDEETWVDRGIRYPEGIVETSVEAGLEPLSIVTQVWTGEWDGSYLERYRIRSLAAALEMKLLRSVREEASATYSIGVHTVMSLFPITSYRLAVHFSCDPERVDELIDLVRSEIEAFRSAPPEEKYSHDVAESQRRDFAENIERNDWWMGQILFALSTGTDEEILTTQDRLFDGLSVDVIHESARKYFDDTRYIEVILYPEKTP